MMTMRRRRCQPGMTAVSEKHQNVAALDPTAADHIAFRFDAVGLENRLRNVETDWPSAWIAPL